MDPLERTLMKSWTLARVWLIPKCKDLVSIIHGIPRTLSGAQKPEDASKAVRTEFHHLSWSRRMTESSAREAEKTGEHS